MDDKEIIMTPYYYRVELGERADMTTEEDDGTPGWWVFYRGRMKFVEHKRFEWREEEPITYNEALLVVKNTRGIDTITGTFKVDGVPADDRAEDEKLNINHD